METKENFYIILEIANYNFYFYNKDGYHDSDRAISAHITSIGDLLLNYMKYEFKIFNLVKFNTYTYDLDTIEKYDAKEVYHSSLGKSRPDNNSAEVNFKLSRSKYLAMTNENERDIFIAKVILNELIAFCDKFKQDGTPLIKMLNQVDKIEFYSPFYSNSKLIDKEKSTKTWIQDHYGYVENKYRIVVENMENGDRKYVELPTKNNVTFYKNLYQEQYLDKFINGEISSFYYIKKYKKNIYLIEWGKVENYLFYPRELKLEKLNDDFVAIKKEMSDKEMMKILKSKKGLF
jgi:hypothetical protein